jgi:maltooligosyltrehalose trehalohydrolase
MLFMGQEYGEERPFQYFVSHGDAALVEAVRKGRSEEFKSFAWKGDVPDPQSEETFRRSVLNWEARLNGNGASLWRLYKTLIQLRRERLAGAAASLHETRAVALPGEKAIAFTRPATDGAEILVIANFGKADIEFPRALFDGPYRPLLSTAAVEWNGPAATSEHHNIHPESTVIYEKV